MLVQKISSLVLSDFKNYKIVHMIYTKKCKNTAVLKNRNEIQQNQYCAQYAVYNIHTHPKKSHINAQCTILSSQSHITIPPTACSSFVIGEPS